MAAAGGSGQAVLPAAIVLADVFARVAEHHIREADRVSQCEREREDADERHHQEIARSLAEG